MQSRCGMRTMHNLMIRSRSRSRIQSAQTNAETHVFQMREAANHMLVRIAKKTEM